MVLLESRKTCMFFKVVATFLKIVLFYLKRYGIWLKDALYLAGTLCATCFFLPEVLHQVRDEMGRCSCFEFSNAYLHVGKNCIPDQMKSGIFNKSDFLQRNATYWKGILFFTAFFRFGEKTQRRDFFHVASLLKANFTERWRHKEVRKG